MGFLKRLLGLGEPSEQEVQECIMYNASVRGSSNKSMGSIIVDDYFAKQKKREAEMDASLKKALKNAGVDVEAQNKWIREISDKKHNQMLKRQAEEKVKKEEEIKSIQNLIDSNNDAVNKLVNGKF